MNNIKNLLQELDRADALSKRRRKALEEIAPRIAGFPKDINLSFGYGANGVSIDFDNLNRMDVVGLMIHMRAGKWTKVLSTVEGKVDYINDNLLSSAQLRIFGAEPPPSCKIVEVDEWEPAQPARLVKKKKVVCSERGLPAV